MRRKTQMFAKGALTILMMVWIIASAGVHNFSHDPMQLVKALEEHHQEVEQHGHAHEDIVDLMYLYHGHAHQVYDHDHSTMFISLRSGSSEVLPSRVKLTLANYVTVVGRNYDLDRPPRV